MSTTHVGLPIFVVGLGPVHWGLTDLASGFKKPLAWADRQEPQKQMDHFLTCAWLGFRRAGSAGFWNAEAFGPAKSTRHIRVGFVFAPFLLHKVR